LEFHAQLARVLENGRSTAFRHHARGAGNSPKVPVKSFEKNSKEVIELNGNALPKQGLAIVVDG
jgi:hypothetical protein